MMKRISKYNLLLPAFAILATGFLLLFCAQKPDPKKKQSNDSLKQSGKASFYANMLHGFNTSNGETYDKNDFTCAHRSMPFNTILSVTNTLNGKNAIVRVNDRGPYSKGRIIDLSRAAAQKLGMLPDGVIKVKIQELTFLNLFPLHDSLFHNGEIIDSHGKLRRGEKQWIRIWDTEDLKHALYMATNMEMEYKLDQVYIKVKGDTEHRNYVLYVPDQEKKEDTDKFIASLRQDGYRLCRHEAN